MKGIDTMSNSTNTNLSNLFFATKSRGSSSADGSSATYNATTRRLTIGAFYHNEGYRSGAVALDKQNNIIVKLSRTGYDKQNSAIHSTQYFFTVVKSSPARVELDKNRKYSVEELGDDLFKLTPQK